jgi:H+/Cl- antiporter ClcA
MMTFLQWMFSDLWTFIGMVIVLTLFGEFVIQVVRALRGIR